MNTLFIDTTSNKEVIVRLTIDNEVFEEKVEIKNNRTQVVIPLIKKLLENHKLKPQDLDEVKTNPGPGSFTGVRVGVAIANAFNFALKKSSLVEPVYF